MPETCPTCGIGHLKPSRTTLFRVYDETLVHVPNVPAWKCDVCSMSYYDPPTLRRFEVLIGEAGPPPNHYTPVNLPPPVDDPVTADDAPETRPD